MCPLGQEGTGLDLGTVRQQGHCRSDSGTERRGGEDFWGGGGAGRLGAAGLLMGRGAGGLVNISTRRRNSQADRRKHDRNMIGGVIILYEL